MSTKGFNKLSKKLIGLGEKAGGKVLRASATSATLPLWRAAQANAPENDRDYLSTLYTGRKVSPGFLKRNVKRKSWQPRKTFVKAMVGPTTEAFYGTSFVELGTSKMPAQPWLVPAYNATKGTVLRRLTKALKRGIDRERKKQ